MGLSCMRNASGHNYRNSSFTVDVAMRQIPRSTGRFLVGHIFDSESEVPRFNALAGMILYQ